MSIEERVAKTLSSFLDEADDYHDPGEPFKFGSSLNALVQEIHPM